MSRRLALAIGLAVMSAGCASGTTLTGRATTVSGNVRVVSDIAYAPGLGADLYLPTAAPKDTAIVWIHGGGFVAGTKTQLSVLAHALAERGYPGMAIQYRLSRGGAWFPATTLEDPGLQAAAANAVEDAGAAVAWLRSPAAASHGLTPSRVVLAGYSAGAITAATAAAVGHQPVDGAVSLAGAALEPDRLSAATPPLLLIHGTLDDTVPAGLAEATCAAARAKRTDCQLDLVDGAGHGLPFEQPEMVAETIATFLTSLG